MKVNDYFSLHFGLPVILHILSLIVSWLMSPLCELLFMTFDNGFISIQSKNKYVLSAKPTKKLQFEKIIVNLLFYSQNSPCEFTDSNML